MLRTAPALLQDDLPRLIRPGRLQDGIGIADVIVAEIQVSQRCALPEHSCQPLCSSIADPIATEIEVNQRWALR